LAYFPHFTVEFFDDLDQKFGLSYTRSCLLLVKFELKAIGIWTTLFSPNARLNKIGSLYSNKLKAKTFFKVLNFSHLFGLKTN